MILINERAKCLSCGALPSLAAASAGQEEHHHHHHHGKHTHVHEEAAGGAGEEVLGKLRVLLPHWIEHNGEHAESFWTWAERARAAGDGHLAAHIEEAARKIEAANRDLEGAVEHIGAAASDHAHLDHEHLH
ncbi:MAG: hypothetical protein U9R72_00970 [Chloroflexota bacterium]|nr:hypothetical protein [Chloroflexota bacterium]